MGDGKPRFLGYVSDVSETGLFVQSSNPREVGRQLEVEFRLPEEPRPVRVKSAEVIWSRGHEGVSGPCPGMGLRFVAISHEAQAAIRRFCSEADPGVSGAVEIGEDCP